jgi:hypothetical protein
MADSNDSDFLHGAAQYAVFLNVPIRRACYLLENGLIPGSQVGSNWIGQKSRILSRLESAENVKLDSTGEAA